MTMAGLAIADISKNLPSPSSFFQFFIKELRQFWVWLKISGLSKKNQFSVAKPKNMSIMSTITTIVLFRLIFSNPNFESTSYLDWLPMSLQKITSFAVSCICVLVIGNSSTVRADLITETFNSLSNGQIVDDEFADRFTVSGINLGGGPDLVVVFDTFATGTDDPDLQDPFDGGNAATSETFRDLQDPNDATSDISRFSNALIIQEDGADDGSGSIDTSPDDEGGRPAGSITIAFSTAIDSVGFDLLDVESTLEEPFSVDFTSGSTTLTVDDSQLIDRDPTVEFGNNFANRIIPLTAAEVSVITGSSITSFDEVTFNLGGSGAIDNISFSPVPEPTVFPILALMGFGLAGKRRRKSS